MKNIYFASSRLLFSEKAPDASRTEKSEKAPEAMQTFSAMEVKTNAKVLALIAREKGKPEKSKELNDLYAAVGSSVDFGKDFCDKNGIKYTVENRSLVVVKDGKKVEEAWQKHLQEIAGKINVIRKILGVSPDELKARIASLEQDGRKLEIAADGAKKMG